MPEDVRKLLDKVREQVVTVDELVLFHETGANAVHARPS